MRRLLLALCLATAAAPAAGRGPDGPSAAASAASATPASAAGSRPAPAAGTGARPALAAGADDPRPTIQQRFAVKAGRPYAHLVGTLHVRDDYYRTVGWGADAGWFFVEPVGVELRILKLYSSLSDAARRVQTETGLVPDARPQDLLLAAGARVSFGYGKVLVLDRFVVHFDPQLAVHGGVTFAETRILPTVILGPSVTVHLLWGLQAKLELSLTLQVESRTRGWIPTVGLLPVLGFGWKPEVGS